MANIKSDKIRPFLQALAVLEMLTFQIFVFEKVGQGHEVQFSQ